MYQLNNTTGLTIKGNNLNHIPEEDFIDLINSGGQTDYLNMHRGDNLYHHRADYKSFIFLSKSKRKIYESDEFLEYGKK